MFGTRANPCPEWALQAQVRMGPALREWRKKVCEDIATFVEELQEDQE